MVARQMWLLRWTSAAIVPMFFTMASCSGQEEPRIEIKPGDTVTVTTEGASLILNGETVARLSKGTEFEVARISRDWIAGYALVNDQKKPGWIRARDVAMSAAIVSGNWPQFHGPNLDNLSTETGLLKRWPSQGPKLVWTAEGIGNGFSSVAIANALIYTAGNRGGDTVVSALDANGAIVWQESNGPAWTSSYEGTRSTPTIDGEHLYHESPLGNVICMNATTGQKIWSRNILEEFDSRNIKWALAESLLVDGDHVICTPGGPQTCIVALDKKTGETVWQSPTADGDLAGYASPTVAELGETRMILQMTAKALLRVDAQTGDLLFRFEHMTRYDVNAMRPIFKDGFVFISSNYGTGSVMVKLDVSGGGVVPQKVWEHKPLDNHHGGVILVDGFLYGSSGRGWHCLEWNTGRSMYQERGVGKGSLTYADGMLYALSENHTMGLVPATPDGHELVGQFELPPGGDGKSWAHPVVCGGRLYIRHGDFLYAYDVSGG